MSFDREITGNNIFKCFLIAKYIEVFPILETQFLPLKLIEKFFTFHVFALRILHDRYSVQNDK